ncbi:hypothetical protein Mal64_23440 [Pseudobythopirellula maris]|uniref:Uncharacterized protein n=2 Tax=Pseudobythopirellula maris TaxID=2527991 RepID=A0A5C5ZNZ1_9BACT|nr:hypothetical protein Mal64_23440 [Pseudobythopirellula maris]
MLVATFVALVALTILTCAMAMVDLGSWDMPVTLGIATVKALLVALIFMHLLHDKLFNSLLLLSAVLFMALFIGMALLDSNEYQPQIRELIYDKQAEAPPL